MARKTPAPKMPMHKMPGGHMMPGKAMPKMMGKPSAKAGRGGKKR